MSTTDPLDNDPAVRAARFLAAQRADLAGDLADLLDALRRATPAARPDDVPGIAGSADEVARLAGDLAHLARVAADARDHAVRLARSLPEDVRPSWARLADAMGESDRNNLARRYRGRIPGGDR